METNQKFEQKKKIMTALLVLVAIMLVAANVKMYLIERELIGLRFQIQELKESFTDGDHSNQELSAVDTPPVADEDTTQVVSSAIEMERPQEKAIVEPQARHKVYLTFDDGPSKYTEEILDILDEYDVKATFFVVGKTGEENKKRLQMIYERGHTVGMHSYSHDYADIYESLGQFRSDFLKSKKYLYDTLGIESEFYRFPGGSSNSLSEINMQVFVDFLGQQGVEYYDWNISSGDGSGTMLSAETIVKNCTEDLEKYGTAIILLHDAASKSTTVEALPQIIEKIQAMEDTVILPITASSQPIHHAIKEKSVKDTEEKK